MARLSFDSAVLIGLDRGDDRAWAWLRRSAENGVAPSVSAAAVAETWRGGSYSLLRRALGGCTIVPVTADLARAAGEATAAVGAATLDAVIAATAAREGAPLLTGDPDDMNDLADYFKSLRVLTL